MDQRAWTTDVVLFDNTLILFYIVAKIIGYQAPPRGYQASRSGKGGAGSRPFSRKERGFGLAQRRPNRRIYPLAAPMTLVYRSDLRRQL